MNSKSSGGKLEGFFNGKGFYIVLFLCAAVIGVSAWMMAAGDRDLAEDISKMNETHMDNHRVETVILPPQEEVSQADEAELQEAAAPAAEEALAETMEPSEDENTQVWREEPVAVEAPSAPVYAWPVSGELERGHSLEVLDYDMTMRDWRTHAGIDISSPLGATVTAAHAGTVESVRSDDLFGTVVTVTHGDGVRTVYANLADMPAVSAGEWVDCGSVIGSVGDTALGEIGQGTHLHFAIEVNGRNENPLDYLPA